MRRTSVTAAVLAMVAGAMVANVAAEVSFKFNGDILYRWQYDYWKNRDSSDNVTLRAGDFSNRYWWNLRLNVVANENLSFALRLSNPRGYFTDQVASNLKWAGAGDVLNVVSVPELYFKWTYSIVTLMGGFISVAGPASYNTTMDLVAFETEGIGPGSARTSGYVNAGLMPWFVATNGTQTGLDLLLGFYKSDAFSVGLDVVATIAADSGRALSADAIKRDQLRFIFAVPMTVKGATLGIQPVMHVRTNVRRSADLKDGNHSIAGGIDVWTTPIKQLTGRVGFAVAGYSNDCQWKQAGVDSTAPLGLLLNAGVKVSPGYGKASVDFAWGNWMDREDDKDPAANGHLLYWDIMYDAPVKFLVFRPRIRIWYTTKSDESTALQARPELDFIAKF